MPILLLFIFVPLIEIGLFIQVGGWLGLWPTLGIVLLTAFVGSMMVRQQGAREMAQLRSRFNELQDPTESLASGAMILFSGALLLTPGFFTDAVGLALLFPPVRASVYKYLRSKVKVASFQMGPGGAQHPQHPQDRVIDGDYENVDPDKKPPQNPSGWTRH